MSHLLKMLVVALTLGVLVSFHDTSWPWNLVVLTASALAAVTGLHLEKRLENRRE